MSVPLPLCTRDVPSPGLWQWPSGPDCLVAGPPAHLAPGFTQVGRRLLPGGTLPSAMKGGAPPELVQSLTEILHVYVLLCEVSAILIVKYIAKEFSHVNNCFLLSNLLKTLFAFVPKKG